MREEEESPMRIIRSSISGVVAVALALVPLAASAERAEPRTETWPERSLTVETIVKKHVAALGGEKLLRAGKSFTFTVSGEKMGKTFTKTVTQARPNKMRVDITSADGPMSKGFDGKVAWIKKGDAAAVAMTAEETASMASHAQFDEPLLDYAKKGMTVKLIGMADVKGTQAYDLEVTMKNGDVEHHFLDANTFLLAKRTFKGKDKDGKVTEMSVRFGDYKKVQGRMVNHSVEWDAEDGKSHKSIVSKVAYDKKLDAKLFAMPK
jgi:outer membrane lipoprotein-sorting protein